MALQDSLNRGDDTRPKIYRMFGVEKELVELPLCRVDDYIAKLYNDIRIKAVLSSSLIEALARVTFVESPTSEELRLRCRKIEAYLDVSFPDLVFMQNVKVDKYQPTSRNDEEDVKGVGQPSEEQENDYKADQGMVGNVGQGAAAGPVRDHALFLLPEDYRQRRRHVIFMDDHLYNAIYSLKASQATGMFKLRYRDRHEGALRFFVMVCIVHELGHIVHTTFFSQSAPAKHGCEAGFAVEKRVFGGEVVLVHDHDEKGVDRQWDDVIGIRFVHDSAGSRYLSIDDKGMMASLPRPLLLSTDTVVQNTPYGFISTTVRSTTSHPILVLLFKIIRNIHDSYRVIQAGPD
ncbi:hypothetical protein VNI00_011496 [Paramarasmius palmivorus]|uniref:Uncharacterized protein n=1 Tax=Paramarasmius palmivorus TaxID=297713 RepID=A0AAW0CEI9_9AGAR